MRSERETYLDVGSSAETDAGRGSGAEAPRDAGRSFSRSALVVLAALALACAAAAAAAVWTTPWGHPQSGAWESSELLRSFASARALADQGTLTTEKVDAGSQTVAVQNSNLFKAGDDIVLLDSGADPEVTEQGKVVLVEAPDTLVLKDALSYPYPKYSFVIVSNVDMPAPTHAPTQAPKPTPASAPAPSGPRDAPRDAVALSGPRDAVDKGDPSGLWGGGRMPQVPPPPGRSKIAVRSRVVAPPKGTDVVPPSLADSNGTVFVFPSGIDGRHRGGGAKHEAMASKASIVVSDHKHSIVVSDHEHGHKAAQGPFSIGGIELLGVVFAAVVCCAGCSVVGCYFCRPPGSAFTDWQAADWAGRFAKLASGMRTAEGQRMPALIPSVAGTTVLPVESNRGFSRGDRLVIKSNVASEVNFVHAVEGDHVIILAEGLKHQHPPGTVIASKTATTYLPRGDDLVDELFQYLDADGNQFLDASELLVLAKHNGFRGTSTEWEQTYSRLAKIHFKENAKQGCNSEQFRKLIDDRSSGLQINDEDINIFLDLMCTDE